MISDKTILKERDELLKNAKNILGGGIGKELYRDIERLIDKLPKVGRLSYYSENMEPYRGDIDGIVIKFIKSNSEVEYSYEMLLEKATEIDYQIKEVFGFDSDKYKYHLRASKYRKDINARIGNLILKFIKDMNFVEKQKEYMIKNRLVEKRIKKDKMKY